MRKVLPAVLLLLLMAPAAHAGKAIKHRPDCDDQYLQYSKANAKRYRGAVLCLMSFVRAQQGLNGLDRSAQLEKAGQRWANRLGKTGNLNHGPSFAAIPKRIAKAGYKASAVNEGLGAGDAGATPYDVVGMMMTQFACTEILDPRFRDAGVGVNLGRLFSGRGIHVVVEFGLEAGAKVPSKRGKPAKSCPHRLPRPPASPVVPSGIIPQVDGDEISVSVSCVAKRPCTFEAALRLVHQGAVSHSAVVEALAPGSATDVVFGFPGGAVADEQARQQSGVELTITSTKPLVFTDLFSAPL